MSGTVLRVQPRGAVLAAATFLLGVLLSGTAFGIFGLGSGAAAWSGKTHAVLEKASVGRECTTLLMPSRLTVSTVREAELDKALETMGLSGDRRIVLRSEVLGGKQRLIWLTIWDWDAQSEAGDTVSISAAGYTRSLTLRNHRQTIAIPEPRSGFIEITGQQTEDGIIAVSLLSGAYPVAVPRMRAGQTVRIEIDGAL